MLIHPYEWSDWFLLVSVTYDRTTYSILCEHATQEEFIEHVNRLLWPDRHWGISAVVPLTEDAFQALEDKWEALGQMETRIVRGE